MIFLLTQVGFRSACAALVAGLTLTLPAKAADVNQANLVEKGALTYVVAASFAPFEYMDNGKITGFDIDLIQAIAGKLKLKPEPLNMEFKGLIPALQGKRADIINSAMYITPARSEQVDFVPYLRIGNRVVVTTENPAKITGRDNSLCGKKVAVTLGGIQESYARQDNERCQKAGLPPVTVMTLPTAQDSTLTLRAGRADAIFDSTPGVIKMSNDVPGVFKAVGDQFEASTQIGIAVRKGDAAIKAAIEAALKEIIADGTYKALIAKWRLPESSALN